MPVPTPIQAFPSQRGARDVSAASAQTEAILRRTRELGRASLSCALLAWSMSILAITLPALSWLLLPMGLALAIVSIVIGTKGRRSARSIIAKATAATWAIALGVTYLILGLAVPVLVSVGLMLVQRL